jgi:hypothetical protein
MEDGKNKQRGPARGETPAETREIDRVLALASVPPMPADAVPSLLARIAEEPQQAAVLPFRPRGQMPRRSLLRYATALPLAASLALGVYLGARGTLDFMLPAAITGVALNEETIDDLGGVSEADDYAAESLS